MSRFLKSSCLALLIGVGVAGTAAAEGEWSGNVAITSDYVFRGFTQTDGAPTVQGGFDWASDDFYAGVWASGVDFGDGTSTEIDFYGGWTPTVGVFGLDLGVIYYAYPDAPDEPEQNFVEAYAGASTTLGDSLEVGASVAYSPDFYLESGQAVYTQFTAGIPLSDAFGVDASLGFQEFLDDDDCDECGYIDYSIGLTTELEGFGLDFRFIGSDGDGVEGLDGDGGPAGERFVVTVSRSM